MALWENKINGQLAIFGPQRVNGKVASVRTQNLTKEVLYASFRRLHELGFRVDDPKNMREKHIELLVRDWWFREKPKSIKTIQNELSRLRVFFSMMGKPGLVRKLKDYLPEVDPKDLVVRAAAKTGKSWVAQGTDIKAAFAKADAKDRRLGWMLRMQLAFGLRREEVIKCKPHVQDQGSYFEVLPGQGKGGRQRAIPIAERQILEWVKSQLKYKNECLGWPNNFDGTPATLEQNRKRYSNLMQQLGFTKAVLGASGHGLRAQFGENYAVICGIIPPSLGGTRGQMGHDDLKMRMQKVSEALGHHRPEIVAAYFCAFGRSTHLDADDRTVKNIEEALAVLSERDLSPVPEERRAHCLRIRDTMELLTIDMSLKQVHALWEIACSREGLDWKEPIVQIALTLEVAALTLLTAEQKELDFK
jgi:integrase